jgi:hypothetical protein
MIGVVPYTGIYGGIILGMPYRPIGCIIALEDYVFLTCGMNGYD